MLGFRVRVSVRVRVRVECSRGQPDAKQSRGMESMESAAHLTG